MSIGQSKIKSILMLVVVLGLLTSNAAFGNQKYQVYLQFYHFGELIAKPLLDVEEGQTTAGTYSVPGQSQYKIVVLVKPAAEGKVFVSLQFSSGKVDIQPNLLVNIGEQTSATVDKVRMIILVDESSANDPDTVIAYRTADS